jgi:hypothetical protein
MDSSPLLPTSCLAMVRWKDTHLTAFIIQDRARSQMNSFCEISSRSFSRLRRKGGVKNIIGLGQREVRERHSSPWNLQISYVTGNPPLSNRYLCVRHIIDIINLKRQGKRSHGVVPGRSCVFNVLNGILLLTAFTSHTRPLNALNPLGFCQNRNHILLRSTSLERCLASLEVVPVVLGTDESEDNDVGGHNADEDALDKGVVRHIFWPLGCLDRRPRVFSAS